MTPRPINFANIILDPVPEDVFEPDEEGKQYGWWFSRTHRLSTPTHTEE